MQSETFFEHLLSDQYLFDVEPYVANHTIFQVYLISSVVLLLILAFFKVEEKQPLFGFFTSFLLSEQQTFDRYLSGEEHPKMNLLMILFMSLQASYLLHQHTVLLKYNLFPILVQLGMATIIIAFLFMLKFALFRSMELLLPWRVNSQFFIYNYRFALFAVSIVYFVINYFSYSETIANGPIFLLIPIFLFYVWLIFRWLYISIRYQVVRSLYFFLYLCTLEIAPLIILWQLID